MTEDQIQKITQSLANATFRSLNIDGLVHAAKFYCIHEAHQKYNELDDKTRLNLLSEIEEQEKAAQEPAGKTKKKASKKKAQPA